MARPPAGLALPVETVMTRRIVQIVEQIPMSEVRNIAAKYDLQRLSGRHPGGAARGHSHEG